MSTMSRVALLLLVCMAVAVNAKRAYLDELPAYPQNWPGVGHKHAEGGGLRNKFGKDFAEYNYTWTKALCMLDSDGDGFSNGVELGDPECQWVKGQPAPINAHNGPISHPGLKSSTPML